MSESAAAERRAIEQDCARLIARYANLNDAGKWEAVAALYAPDGRMSRPTAPDDWIEGRAAILAAFTARPPRTTRHICSNIVIDVTGPDQAEGESAMLLFTGEGPPKVGSFHDRFVLTADGWRFAERRGTLTF
ncbi:nuclear transport factor 2 family protein [Sphingomonas hengshuiensis]|uniref:nuclear transport factor 2 family protein n=1 Tax=Sphingomonas hengshuiensis TaxID=1609977 RepID=UPI000ADCE380|nr:nuclear transport factor 2 family protein [Sphingomonas hengshuiensis]